MEVHSVRVGDGIVTNTNPPRTNKIEHVSKLTWRSNESRARSTPPWLFNDRKLFSSNLVIFGWYRLVWPIFDNAARMERQRSTVRPKKTTALRRTQIVCIFMVMYLGRSVWDNSGSSTNRNGARLRIISSAASVGIVGNVGGRVCVYCVGLFHRHGARDGGSFSV